MDVDAYLDRIKAPHTGIADLARLRELHHAHLSAVPFENLEIHRGVRLSLAPEDLFDKIVRRRRGGFCFELNGLFAVLLERSGYSVDRVAAGVHDGERLGPLSHLALVVSSSAVPGSRWLVDVGFGDHSVFPLDFTSRVDQDDPAGRFLLADAPDGDVDVFKDGRLQYRLETRARDLTFFEAMCWYHQTSPDSPFTRKTVCTLLTGEGRVTVSDRNLIVTTGDSRSETRLGPGEPLLTAYRDRFGIDLPAGTEFHSPALS